MKIRNAQAAGALAVLVQNNVAGDPTAMGTDGTPDQPTIPAYMVSIGDGQSLQSAGDGASTTISAALAYFATNNADIMAGFSSQGPTDVDFRVKPDVVAPGVNVLSAVPASFCSAPPCFAFLSGTSMAEPHLAGSAAVIRGQKPDWTPAQVRSAVVNTAVTGVLKNSLTAGPENDSNVVGAGLENLLAAVGATVALDPVSVSFGGVPAGSGQTRQLALTLTNLGASARTLDLAVGGQPGGVAFGVSPSTVALAAGESKTVTVTMSATKGAPAGPKQAQLDVSEGGTVRAHAVLFTLVK